MSSTTIKAVYPGDRAENLEELRNAHGSAPVVWNAMAKHYLGAPDFGYWSYTEQLWPIYKRPEMPAHHRAVLMMTYDNAMVMKSDYKRAAADIRAWLVDFPPKADRVNHWPRIAELFDSDPDCQAIGFYMTSVGEDPFQGPWSEEKEDFDAPDWGVFWNVYEEAAAWEVVS